ncbi:adhesion G protein-coupled receptor E3-like [Amphiura filiformis]|uniref:adhesion G protein-coupled receptor E3-like n=1 Tax=Amphiura filiformis TaxID=82378 RepID=UPI003B21DDF5
MPLVAVIGYLFFLSNILVPSKANNHLESPISCYSRTLMNITKTEDITISNEDFDICLQEGPSTRSTVCTKAITAPDNTTTTNVRIGPDLLTDVINVLDEAMMRNNDRLCDTDIFVIEVRSGILPVDRATQKYCQQNIWEKEGLTSQLNELDESLTLDFLFGNVTNKHSYYVEFSYEFHNYSYTRNLLTDDCEICDGKIMSADEYLRQSRNGTRPFISIGNFHSDVNIGLENGSVLLCDEGREPGERPLFSKIPGGDVLAQTLTAFSLVGLFLTFITYAVFKKLRNVPGKITMNLLVALFVALSSICFGPLLLYPDSVCLISAIVFHYFWLAAFAWMNIVSIDATYILSCNPFMSNDASSGRYRLSAYFVYGWGGPGVFVLVCVALHFCKCTSFGFEYGFDDGVCWTNDGASGLYFFGVPVGILLAINVILLCVTVLTIWRSSRRIRKLGKHNDKLARREFIVFIKLFTLMGLPWILGCVTAFYFTPVLEYTYIILNSLQGVLIFVVLVVTGRGGDLWREKWRMKRQKSQSPSGRNGAFMGTGETRTTGTRAETPMITTFYSKNRR